MTNPQTSQQTRGRRRPSAAGATAFAALAVAFGGVASGAIPDETGVIHACYDNVDGTTHIIDYPRVGCRPTQTLLSWSQQGPAGAPGAQGPAGAQGAAGPPGPKGGFASVRRAKWSSQKTANAGKTVTISCKSGEAATGGGFQLFGSYGSVVTTRSFPVGGSPPTGWQVRALVNGLNGAWGVQAWAVCAKL